jgi:hypothetical protein
MAGRNPQWPGLVIHHPIENEDYLVTRAAPPRLMARAEAFTPVSRTYRNYWPSPKNDQNGYPACTAFGTLTALACTPVTHPGRNPLVKPLDFYAEIQAEDKKEGRDYPEGATTDAAMRAARARGFISAWYFGYTMDTAHRIIAVKPFIMGSIWYDSQMQPDAEGIIRITPNAKSVGGHLFALNAYNAKRGLWRIPQTWGDGDYFISDEDLHRMLREDGELSVFEELPTPKALPAPGV